VDQATKLAFLRQPASYPEGTLSVEIKETHMSWVFLTKRHAYKLKKPVRHDFLDFSTSALRRHFCTEELRLNRRLAPNVYLTVVPLTVTPSGALEIGGSGIPVDWLVKMRRLTESRTLENAIRAGSLLPRDISALLELLGDFYRAAPRIAIFPEDYRRKIRDGIENNRVELARYCPPSMDSLIQTVAEAQAQFLATQADTFTRRTAEGAIVEGHGDLRPEHVFLGPRPQIIDCLEFNRDFRILDVADDLALLAMECDQLRAPDVARALFRIEPATDTPPALTAFYKSYRAALRAKLAIWHLKDRPVADPAGWQERACRYLALAERERQGMF
jgi:aminoglycoside phosphotransferase family enzyme